MKTLTGTMLALSALGFAAAGCSGETRAQKEIDRQAEAIDKSYEAQADVVEALGKGAPDEESAEKRAEALRSKGEAIKDDLKSKADELDDVAKN